MAIIKAAAGGTVTIGSTAGGYPTQTTWGGAIRAVDAGVPLADYVADVKDPLTVWKTQPSVRKVIGFAAREFARIPWQAFQRVDDGDRRRVAGSPAERIFKDPTGRGLVTGYRFWRDMVTDSYLYDLALAILTSDGLVRIPPGLVHIRSDHFGQPVRIEIATPAKGGDPIDVTDVPKILTYGWHATMSGGVSPMVTLAAILDENIRAVRWRSDQWRNAPKVTGLLKRPASDRAWRPDQREKFEKEWSAWKNSAKAGGTPILEGGMEYEPLPGLNPKDATDIEGRQLTDVEVASAFHIPPELVGARAGTYSNIDAFRTMLYGPVLGPLFEELAQAVEIGGIVKSLDRTAGLYVEPNIEAGMAGSFLEQARVMQTATGGPWMTRAEARGRMNLPHIDGTNELITPLNVTAGGQASPTDTGTQNLGGDNADPDARQDY